jgi:hypothetical protein
VFALVIGCGGGDGGESIYSLDGIVALLRETDYEIGDPTSLVLQPTIVGAVNGFELEIDGKPVEMYQYESAVEAEELASRRKVIWKLRPGTFEVYSKGAFVILLSVSDEIGSPWYPHPDSESLRKLFDKRLSDSATTLEEGLDR